MRALVFLLIFANLLFFAWTRGYFGDETRPDAHRLAQQIAPERLAIVSKDAPPAKPAPPPQPVPACLAWASVDAKIADAIEAAAGPAGLKVVRQSLPAAGPANNGFWVFIPPQANRAGADRKAAELRELGVKEFFVIQDDGPNRYALSLGVFSTEVAATAHLAKLKGLGVRSAVVGPRGRVEQAFAVEVRGDAPDVTRWQSTWPGPVPSDCPA